MKALLFPLILVIGLTPNLQAQELSDEFDPEKLIEYRQDFMQAVKSHNNAIKAIVNGTVPYDQHLDMHLGALEQLFAEIARLFPEGSDFGETNAKAEIWDNPQKFQQTVEKANQAFADFKQVVAGGDNQKTRTAFKEFGRASCGSCHKTFKEKD